jgi:hypothetical protein
MKANVITMDLEDIKIKDSFTNTIPSERKMEKCRDNWRSYGTQDRYIVINKDNELIDGYIMYLVLKEFGVKDAQVMFYSRKDWKLHSVKGKTIPAYRTESTTYIYGVHPNSPCENIYVWRIPKNWDWMMQHIEVGDKVYCQTKFGISPVVVTKIEISNKPPREGVIKRVASNSIYRNDVKITERS